MKTKLTKTQKLKALITIHLTLITCCVPVYAQLDLYGLTMEGGNNVNYGTLFKCTSSGTLTTLVDFSAVNSVWNLSNSDLIQGNDGNLYGVTSGYCTNQGSLFKCTPNGILTTLVNFDTSGNSFDIDPNSLIQASDSNLYGMTIYGVIFKYTTKGQFTTLVNFSNYAYFSPFEGGSFIQASDGNFYGITQQPAYGTIFKCTPSGLLTALVTFNGTNGIEQNSGNLIQASDGNLYGMTNNGGSLGFGGTIFKCTTSGTLTTLVNFDSASGDYPVGNLIQASDGNFYGTTSEGGMYNQGTFFRCSTSGVLTTLVNFNISIIGTFTDIIQASDGNFYSNGYWDGDTNKPLANSIRCGTIFKCTPSGTVTAVFNFDSANGIAPSGNLLAGAIPAGINGLVVNSESVKLFPNPSNGLFSVQSNTIEVNSIVEIYNMLGEKIYTAKLNPTNTQIDLSNNPSGIYLYRVLTETRELISTGKMIIQK